MKDDSLIVLKNLLIEMAVRVATLEKILIDKNIISLEDLESEDQKMSQEIIAILNEKK